MGSVSTKSTVKPNRRERRNWDKYVSEAREVFSEVEIGDVLLTVYIPSADAIAALNESDDLWVQLEAVLGSENFAALHEVAAEAPVTALSNLLGDILKDLGLTGDSENSNAA